MDNTKVKNAEKEYTINDLKMAFMAGIEYSGDWRNAGLQGKVPDFDEWLEINYGKSNLIEKKYKQTLSQIEGQVKPKFEAFFRLTEDFSDFKKGTLLLRGDSYLCGKMSNDQEYFDLSREISGDGHSYSAYNVPTEYLKLMDDQEGLHTLAVDVTLYKNLRILHYLNRCFKAANT